MSSQPFYWVIPQADAHPEAIEVLQRYQITHEFYQEALYREVQHIQAQAYQALASQHRQELEQLRRDVNIMGWFNRWLQRRSP